MERKSTWLIPAIFGAVLLPVSIWLSTLFPAECGPMPKGFLQRVIAFEFIQTPGEVETLFSGEHSEECIRRMDLGNHFDYLLMALYGGLLFSYSFLNWTREKSTAFLLGSLLGLLAPLADAMENQQLLSITANFQTGDIAPQLSALSFWVNLKFGALILFFLLQLPAFWRFGFTARLMLPVSLICGASFFLSFFLRGYPHSLFTPLLAILFFLLTLSCWIQFIRISRS